MLAGSITPRPRPPAKSRRTSSQVKASPPPPYRLSLPNDPCSPSEHGKHSSISSRNEWAHFPFSAKAEQWDERSREELSNLLHKADEIIKDRELELNVTSAVCKSLYEDNLELKGRHQALLARLPPSPASSSPLGSTSLSPSPTPSDSQLPQSPHCYGADDSRSSSNTNTRLLRTHPHFRRVSVSPADLALLSDQNAELLAKLEKLEADSIQADQAGRRKLRSLEKEIQGLRDELEETRAKSDELEKKARVVSEGAALRDEETQRKRQEREERLRALRSKTDNGDAETQIRDFAPGGALSMLPGGKNRLTLKRRHFSEAVLRPHHGNSDEDRPRRAPPPAGLSRSTSLSRYSQTTLSIQPPDALAPECALVSRLLSKIQELEETNAQITDQQAQTVDQLQKVQKDATSLRLAYESLGDVEGIEWVVEDSDGSPGSGDDEENETIRFASLRRTISAETSLDFDDGIDANMRSTLKNPILPHHAPVSAHPKARRSVVGLFDSPQEGVISTGASPVSDIATPVLDMMIPGLPPVPFVPQPSNTSTSTTPSLSPVLSPSLACAVSSGSEEVPRRPTLDSELGAVLDGHWDNTTGQDDSPGNHHFHRSSIARMSIIPSAEVINSAVSLPILHTRPELEHSSNVFSPPKSLSRRSSALQSSYWQGAQERTISSQSDPLPGSPAEKQRRKSQTIRMRAVHWGEGRFNGTLLPAEKRHRLDINHSSTPVPERLASAFDAIVDTMNRSKSEVPTFDSRDEKGSPKENAMVRMRSADEMVVASPPAPRQRGIVAFVLEVWLWLQFAIVVIVFVWAMARRGPKSVLEDAGRRKTVGH